MLASQLRGKELGRIIYDSEVHELREASLNLGPNLLQFRYVTDRRVKIAQPAQGVLPHLRQAASAQAENRIQQRTALQTQRPRSGTQRTEEHETAVPLLFAPEGRSASAQEGERLVLRVFWGRGRRCGMLEECVADKVVLLAIVPANEGDRQGPDRSGGNRSTGFVGKLPRGFIPGT